MNLEFGAAEFATDKHVILAFASFVPDALQAHSLIELHTEVLRL